MIEYNAIACDNEFIHTENSMMNVLLYEYDIRMNRNIFILLYDFIFN